MRNYNFYYRTYFSPSGAPSYIMSIISSCTVHSVQVIQKLKKYSILVSYYYYTNIRTPMGSCTNYNYYLFIDEGNQALQEFLCSRNPRQQHSCSLESYLIKPIQRILKYPLLLQQLRNLTDPHSDQHLHLVGK